MKKFNIYIIVTCFLLVLFSCNEDSSNDISTVGSSDGQGGSLATFALKNNYLYTVDYSDLSVFNIDNEKKPVKVNSVNVGFDIETLFSFNDYLFIGSQSAMFIYDISSPELPKKLSESSHFTSCDPVVANEKYAYVTLHSNSSCGGASNELITYDISDLENPIELNIRSLTEPKGLALYGNYLLVCDDSVKIFDVSEPSNSLFLSEIPVENSIDIIIRGNHAFIITENSIEQYQLNTIDINNYIKLSTFDFTY